MRKIKLNNSQDNKINYTNNSNIDNKAYTKDDIDYKEVLNSILRKKKWGLTTASLVLFFIFTYTLRQRIVNPIYQGSFSLLIKDPLESVPRVGGAMKIGISFNETLRSNEDKYDIGILKKLLKSPIFLDDLAKKYNIKPINLSNSINILDDSRLERPWDRKGVLLVNFNTNNKEKGKLIINSLSEKYLNESLRRKQQKINDGLKFLKSQAPIIQEQENKLQSKLVSFREKHKLIDPIEEGNSLKTQQQKIENEIIELKSDISRLENVRKEIQNGTISARGFKEEMKSGLSISDFDQSLLSQLISVEKEIAIAESKYTQNSSVVKGLKSRLKEIQPLLLKNQFEAVDLAINLSNLRLENLYSLKKDVEQKFLIQPSLIKNYQKINQELEFANNNLLNLNSTIANFELELAQSRIPWRIISKPRMKEVPIKPSFRRNMSRGFILALVLGIISALIRDKLDNVFNNSSDVDEAIKLPSLGYVPHLSNVQDSRSQNLSILQNIIDLNKIEKSNSNGYYQYENFFMIEALRDIYTSIRFLNIDKKLKTIALSSSVPKEGKSLINILLAKTFSDMGEKVLLIDADMRKPLVHVRLGLDNIIGLSDLLVDNSKNLEGLIQSVPEIENLSVLTSGTKVPDPTRLLNSDRFGNVVKDLNQTEKFDIVIFDTPPIIGLADTVLISKKVTGIVLIISLDYVDRRLPKESIKRITTKDSNILGYITNSVSKDESKNNLNYGSYGRYKQFDKYSYSNYIDKNIVDDQSILEKKEPPDENNKTSFQKNGKVKIYLTKIINNISSRSKVFFNWLDS